MTELHAYELRLLARLRALGLDALVELPQLVVAGDTSSGKSSLLSALSGIAFPSSSELTTRCVTRLSLGPAAEFRGFARIEHRNRQRQSSEAIYTPTHEAEPESEELTDSCHIQRLEDVPGVISRLTTRILGDKRTVSDDRIIIDLQGPNLPALVLTDLPGLVRTVNDNEDANIIPRVRDMVKEFMNSESSVILAVLPANVDVHNAEILQMAHAIDPEGRRTLAVVTKLDLVDKGAEPGVLELVLNHRKALKLGYHAVKCRSEQAVLDGISIQDALKSEKQFFLSHAHWSGIPSTHRGSSVLQARIGQILQDNVRLSLPRIKSDIDARIHSAEKDLEELGGLHAEYNGTLPVQRREYFSLIAQYARNMNSSASGSYEFDWQPKVPGDEKTDIRLRALLREQDEKFKREVYSQTTRATTLVDTVDDAEEEGSRSDQRIAVGDWVQICMNESKWIDAQVAKIRNSDIQCKEHPGEWLGSLSWRLTSRSHSRKLQLKQLIRENRGAELAIFPSYRVFSMCVKQTVESWSSPAISLIDSYAHHSIAVSDYWITSLGVSPDVEGYLRTIGRKVLAELVKSAKQEVDVLLQRESRPYTQDTKLQKEFDSRRQDALTSQFKSLLFGGALTLENALQAFASVVASTEDREALEIDMALRTYLEVAVRRVVDMVPMQLNDLVLEFVRKVQDEAMEATDEKIAQLMTDPPERVERRRLVIETLKCLRAAKDAIETEE